MDLGFGERHGEAGLAGLIARSRAHVAPIHWGDRAAGADGIRHNGTCFALKLGGRAFGVTANHVVQRFLEERAGRGPGIALRIAGRPFELRLIDCERGLDLATFELDEAEMAAAGMRACEVPHGQWPPPPPAAGEPLIVAGFPAARRGARAGAPAFEGMADLLRVTSVGRDFVEIQVREGEMRGADGRPLAPGEVDLGGLSGAPAWALGPGSDPPSPAPRLAGMLYRGSRRLQEDARGAFALLFLRRLDSLRLDGRIARPLVID